jgi:hypothetical protein
LLIKRWVKFLEKVIEGHTRPTVMTLKVGVILYRINVSSCFVFVLLGISTDRAAKVVEIRFDPLKLL